MPSSICAGGCRSFTTNLELINALITLRPCAIPRLTDPKKLTRLATTRAASRKEHDRENVCNYLEERRHAPPACRSVPAAGDRAAGRQPYRAVALRLPQLDAVRHATSPQLMIRASKRQGGATNVARGATKVSAEAMSSSPFATNDRCSPAPLRTSLQTGKTMAETLSCVR